MLLIYIGAMARQDWPGVDGGAELLLQNRYARQLKRKSPDKKLINSIRFQVADCRQQRGRSNALLASHCSCGWNSQAVANELSETQLRLWL
jgi:hypothetical protein